MTRADSDEHYVIGLCDHVLGRKARRQHRFKFLVGDPGKDGRRGKQLPVDAYYEDLALVVEFMEQQHSTAVPFFDKLHRLTVSGVDRGQQRRRYDELRRQILPEHGIALITLDASLFRPSGTSRKKLLRDRSHDELVVREKLARFLT
jgi:hypothetical protein